MSDIDEMKRKSIELVEHCHCPYSGYHVCAVLEDAKGNLHFGVNVENASYGLTNCAERSAVFSAVSMGITDFKSLLIYSPDSFAYPCGACRQVLSEFCKSDFRITICDSERTETLTLEELLPFRFSAQE